MVPAGFDSPLTCFKGLDDKFNSICFCVMSFRLITLPFGATKSSPFWLLVSLGINFLLDMTNFRELFLSPSFVVPNPFYFYF